MHSVTTTFGLILTDMRAAFAHIAAADRVRTQFLAFLWARFSRTAQLFDLFETLLADWRNCTLPGAATPPPPPTPNPAPSPRARRVATMRTQAAAAGRRTPLIAKSQATEPNAAPQPAARSARPHPYLRRGPYSPTPPPTPPKVFLPT